jgi:hypothetical protein
MIIKNRHKASQNIEIITNHLHIIAERLQITAKYIEKMTTESTQA